jgi:hypothetical protein
VVGADGAIYFVVSDVLHGYQIWRTTAGGAEMIPNVTPGIPSQLTAGGDGSIYFVGTSKLYRLAPGSSTPTAIADFVGSGTATGSMFVVGNVLYFTGRDAGNPSATVLRRFDPASGQPSEAVTLPSSGGALRSAMSPVRVGNHAYFGSDDGSDGSRGLYRIGEAADSAQAIDDGGADHSSYPGRLTLAGDKLFYTLVEATGNAQVWVTSVSSTSASVVADLTPGVNATTTFSSMTAVGDELYFSARPAIAGAVDRLYRSDGTPGGTGVVAATAGVTTATNLNTPRQLTAMGGKLYFIANDANGSAVFAYDPATPGTPAVRLTPQFIGTFAGEFMPVFTTLRRAGDGIFAVLLAGPAGTTLPTTFDHMELWRTGGTPATTEKVQDLRPTPYATRADSTYDLVDDGQRLFFFAWVPATGLEPYSLPLVDMASPTVVGEVGVERATGPALPGTPALRVRFSEDVHARLSKASVTVTPLAGGAALTVSAFGFDYTTNTAQFTLPKTLADGDYRVTFNGVADASGNPLGGPGSMDFFVLGGDANHDRKVDFQDLVVVAQNYGRTGGGNGAGGALTSADGDFNYDGKVDFSDLVTVAQRYDTTLPAAGAAPAASAAVRAAVLAAFAPPVSPPVIVAAKPVVAKPVAVNKPLFSVVPVKKPKPSPAPARRK